MFRSVLWKEWREQRWKMALGCVLLLGFCAISLHARVMSDGATFFMVFFIGGLLLPLFAVVGCIGQDREEGSFNYLMSLPIRSESICLAKTVICLLIWLVPVLGAFFLSLMLVPGREWTILEIYRWYFALIFIALIFQVWTFAFGMTQPSEARVGLVGLAIVVFWLAVSDVRSLAFLSPFSMLFQGRRAASEQAARSVLAHSIMLFPMWFGALALFKRTGGRKT